MSDPDSADAADHPPPHLFSEYPFFKCFSRLKLADARLSSPGHLQFPIRKGTPLPARFCSIMKELTRLPQACQRTQESDLH